MSPAVIDADKLRQRSDGEIHDGAAANKQGGVSHRDPATRSVEAANPSTASPDPQRAQDNPGKDPREDAFLGDRLAQGLMTVLAALGLLLSGATIYLIARTVKLQRDATNHALSAANAGWKSVEVTRGQAIAYLHAVRAFVPKRPAPTAEDLVENKPTKRIANALMAHYAPLIVQFENVGSTVAKSVRIHFETEAINERAQPEFRELSTSRKQIDLPNVAPRQRPEVELLSALPLEMQRLEDSGHPATAYFVIRGEISYRDVYGERYRTAFVYFWPFGLNGRLPLSFDAALTALAKEMPAFEHVESAEPEKK